MSDTNTSGPAPDGNAETPNASAAEQGAASFGTSRGSGLARGKRSTPPAAGSNAGKPADSAYKPSDAVQVVSSKSEYQNPFAPAEEAPAKTEEAAVSSSENQQAAAETPAVAENETAPGASEQEDLVPEENEEKAELNILPPAEDTRPAQSWESSHGTREERRTFRPERRSGSRNLERQGAGDMKLTGERERRQDRRDAAQEIERKHREEKPEGFFGWLKNLFLGGGKPEKNKERRDGDGSRGRDGHRRRRHRGGRGGGYRGDDRGGDRGHHHGGGRSHDHRGGRGGHRHRDRGGRGHRQGGGV